MERLRVREAWHNTVRQLKTRGGWEVFCEPAAATFSRHAYPVSMIRAAQSYWASSSVSLEPGAYFRSGGETSGWIRINAAYTNESRTVVFMR